MNAKSLHAAYADRVEAVAASVAQLFRDRGLDPPEEWYESDSDITSKDIARSALAADACEAERNPNPTDEALALCIIALESIDRYTKYPETAIATASAVLADKRVAGFARRPVSSEDVHREERT